MALEISSQGLHQNRVNVIAHRHPKPVQQDGFCFSVFFMPEKSTYVPHLEHRLMNTFFLKEKNEVSP